MFVTLSSFRSLNISFFDSYVLEMVSVIGFISTIRLDLRMETMFYIIYNLFKLATEIKKTTISMIINNIDQPLIFNNIKMIYFNFLKMINDVC